MLDLGGVVIFQAHLGGNVLREVSANVSPNDKIMKMSAVPRKRNNKCADVFIGWRAKLFVIARHCRRFPYPRTYSPQRDPSVSELSRNIQSPLLPIHSTAKVIFKTECITQPTLLSLFGSTNALFGFAKCCVGQSL